MGPPVIDLSALLHTNPTNKSDEINVKEAIVQACKTWGFFQVINHGIYLDTLYNVHQSMVDFFDLPQATKTAINVSKNNSRGYNGKELTKQKVDMKELFDVGHKPFPNLPDNHPDNTVVDGFNQWPSAEELPLFRPSLEKFYAEATELAGKLMEVLAEDLKVPTTFFQGYFENQTSFVRLNYYPLLGSSADPTSLGISRHTDAGGLTLLMQDFSGVSGLEVYSGSKEDAGDGEWVSVVPVPGSLTINTGDMLQVWSNDAYKAPEHRVRPSSRQKRYSAPFFYNPSYDSVIAPVTAAPSSACFRPIVWETFRRNRFLGDYENVGIETQIEDFRIDIIAANSQRKNEF